MRIQGSVFEIRPIAKGDLSAVLEVYRQCEDFLALGPEPRASMPMVLKDIETSQAEGGVFCGIYDRAGKMIGVVDFVPEGFAGERQHAFIELLMIAAPHRGVGIGAEVVRLVESEVAKRPHVCAILSGVQVNNPAAIRFWQRCGYRVVGGPEQMPDQTTVFHLRKELEAV